MSVITGQLSDQLSSLISNPGNVTSSPMYQFAMDQGTSAINRSAGASGHLNSGNRLVDLTTFGQGLASTSFSQYASLLGGLLSGQQSADAQQQQLTNQSTQFNQSLKQNQSQFAFGQAQQDRQFGISSGLQNTQMYLQNAGMQQQNATQNRQVDNQGRSITNQQNQFDATMKQQQATETNAQGMYQTMMNQMLGQMMGSGTSSAYGATPQSQSNNGVGYSSDYYGTGGSQSISDFLGIGA